MGRNIRPALTSSKSLQKNQDGIIAIFSVLIIMGILGLLTIGFSSIIRQAQKRTLDDHLSNQAFYAAESGVNMAINKIEASPATVAPKTDCPADAGDNYDVDPANNISVSCLLINTTVPNLEYSKIDSQGVVSDVQLEGGSAGIVEFEWDSADGSNRDIPSTHPDLLDNTAWGSNIGLLKIELSPADTGLSRSNLVGNSYAFYLYPSTDSSADITVEVDSDDDGRIIKSYCNPAGSTYRCKATISLGQWGADGVHYYLRQSSVYNSVAARTTFKDDGSNRLDIRGSQALVDATGRANDVYRRIQVRVPINSTVATGTVYNPYALFGGDRICKLYSVDGYSVGSNFRDDCTGEASQQTGTVASTNTNNPGNPSGGNAGIGACDGSANQPATCGAGGTSGQQFVWDFGFVNRSNNTPSSIQSCTWYWGDGSSNTYTGYGCRFNDNVSHTYPNLSQTILNSNGNQGCRRYTITLEITFTVASGITPRTATTTYGPVDAPRGTANDVPNGICHTKYRRYP